MLFGWVYGYQDVLLCVMIIKAWLDDTSILYSNVVDRKTKVNLKSIFKSEHLYDLPQVSVR